jgi:hypothetical protein
MPTGQGMRDKDGEDRPRRAGHTSYTSARVRTTPGWTRQTNYCLPLGCSLSDILCSAGITWEGLEEGGRCVVAHIHSTELAPECDNDFHRRAG